MDEKTKERIRKVLTPLLLCSVENRYMLFYSSQLGKGMTLSLNFEGSVNDVLMRVMSHFDRFGGVDLFIKEFEKIPKPNWYKE